jgi:hypothetical protein
MTRAWLRPLWETQRQPSMDGYGPGLASVVAEHAPPIINTYDVTCCQTLEYSDHNSNKVVYVTKSTDSDCSK